MSESIKLRNSIIEKFDQVKNDSFDESTIKALLIDIREYIKSEAILRELADFIAHPRRDRGISHKLLNSRYAKLSLVEEQLKRIEEGDGWKNIKTEWDYSHAVLSSISVDKIESKLFKILFIDGIEDIAEATLKKYYKMGRKGRKDILKILDVSYFQSDGYHILKNIKHRTIIEDILKFIRGAVSGKSAFEESTLVKDLESAVKNMIGVFNIDSTYLQSFKAQRKNIVLCIMCLLHDARLTFYDGNEARIFLTLNDKRLALATEGTVFQFSFFTSSLEIQSFITQEEFLDIDEHKELPWINAKRNLEGKLVLIR